MEAFNSPDQSIRPAAIILDFDGVVVDSMGAHLRAWCAAVAEVFHCELPDPQTIASHATRTIANILARRFGDATLASALVAAKERSLTGRLRTHPVPLLPGVAAFCAAVQAAGIPLGVASNSSRGFVTAALAVQGLRLSIVLGNEDSSRPKPEPDIFWECANRLGVDPKARSEITVYEDSPHGLKAARAAGMLAIGVTTDRDAESLTGSGARFTCAHLGEALARGWHVRVPGR